VAQLQRNDCRKAHRSRTMTADEMNRDLMTPEEFQGWLARCGW
jgi:hypothetical protein